MSNFKYVGANISRIDGLEKVTGAAVFVDDIDFGANLLHAEVVESPYAHALIKSIDYSEAEKIPGVVKIVTAKDFPYKFGLYMKDHYIFAKDRVRFVGEQVAAVVARTPKIAQIAAKLIKVTYEELTPIFSPLDGVAKDAILIHPDLDSYVRVPWFYPEQKSNVAHWRKTRKGNIDIGFQQADIILEDTYTVPRYAHCAIEPHVIVGKLDYSGRLTLWAASQSPYAQRNVIAEALAPLGFSHQNVRVITPHVGGGFGGKAGVSMEIIGAALAVAVKGHPVKLRWRREQEFYNTSQRQGVIAKIKLGAKKDGTIVALDYSLYWDAGAYVEYGANVVNAAGLSATGPYNIENVKIDSLCVYTNLPPCGAYRGFGYSEFHFGLESQIEEMAKKIGLDSIKFRKKNAIKEGDALTYGAKMNPSGLQQAIDKVADAVDWYTKEKSEDPNKVIGKGFSLLWKAPAMPPNASSSAFIKFNEDGSLNVLVSGIDMGQGLLTVMAQVAAEVLAVPPHKIRVETPDTDRNPYEWQTVGSHVTWGCGNAVKLAAEEVRNKIFTTINRAKGYNTEDLYLEDEQIKCKADANFSLFLKDFVINGIMTEDGTFRGGPIMGSGMFMPEFTSTKCDPATSKGGKPNVHYTVGAAAAVIEVDKQTGKMKVLKYALAVDVGKALNPSLIKGQIVGGIVQGLATILYEDMRFDAKGKMLNPNFTDYKIPTALDIPDEIIPIIIETPQPDGPFGARGVGEHTMIPVAPTVANAVADATGVRIKSMPITAEKVALAIAELNNEK